MALRDFQTALGRSVRATPGAVVPHDDLKLTPQEQRALAGIIHSAGFHATRKVQRSWSEGRAATGARLTLSALPLTERRRLVGAWVDAGGGTNSFFTAEADAFLAFIAPQLPTPSHALSLCQFERAVLRAEAGAATFIAPDAATLDPQDRLTRANDRAALIQFHGDLAQLLASIDGDGALPPLAQHTHPFLVAPGIAGLARPADSTEVALWQALGEPCTLGALRRHHGRATIDALWTEGVLAAA